VTSRLSRFRVDFVPDGMARISAVAILSTLVSVLLLPVATAVGVGDY
jgi:hypothetical protein